MTTVHTGSLFGAVTGWEGAELTINPLGTPETWEYDTEIGNPSATAREVLENIATWTQDAGRSWTGSWSATATYALTGYGVAVELTGSTGTPAWTVSPGLQALMDWSSGTKASMEGADPAVGTVETQALWIGQRYKGVDTDGVMSGSGSFHTIPLFAEPFSPKLEFLMVEGQATRLSAIPWASPREVDAYDTIESAWRRLQLGSLSRRRSGLLHYHFSPDVLEAS